LKTSTIILTLTAFFFLLANLSSQTLTDKRLKFPVTAVADSGTILNKQRVGKVLEIARYTIDHQEFEIGSDLTESSELAYQSFQTTLTIDSVNTAF